MRYVCLIRHAMPDIPLGERWCVGRTDLPLGTVGKMQAALLPFVPELRNRPVFCSRLSRAIETARPLCPAPAVQEGLEEQDMGVWDGLSFTEIRRRFPDLYEARGGNPGLMPPGSESMAAVHTRMQSAVLHCLGICDGDPVIVSHKSAISSLTGRREELNYTSLSVLDETLRPLEVGRSIHPALTEKVCEALLEAAATPSEVRAHCRAVAAEALRIAESSSLSLDRSLLLSSALLHDIARKQPHHPETGAAWLRALGYSEAADVISQHHDYAGNGRDEAAVLFLADKHIMGVQRVSVTARFSASAGRCLSEEALAAHERRLQTALLLERELDPG